MKKPPRILVIGEGMENQVGKYLGNPNVDYANSREEVTKKMTNNDYNLILVGYDDNSKESLEIVGDIKTRGKHLNTFIVCRVNEKKIIDEVRKKYAIMREDTVESCLELNTSNGKNRQ